MIGKLNQHALPMGQGTKMRIESQLGFNPAGNYRPASFRITEKEEAPPTAVKAGETKPANPPGFAYPAGMGNVMMNGCFGTGYQPTDPCSRARIPKATCRNMIDAAAFVGVGFDGRGGYNAQSRKASLIQRTCAGKNTFMDSDIPDIMNG